MHETPSSNRIHIGFFGRRNAGKSSVVNAVTNQEMSIVSNVKGTTTDPVKKSMEILPLGPCVIIDTPGYDDEGSLGELRMSKTKKVLNHTDVAVLVVDATVGLADYDQEMIKLFKAKEINYLLVYNKCDLLDVKTMRWLSEEDGAVLISAKDKKNIEQLKEKIGLVYEKIEDRKIVADIVFKDDIVVLVTPIDESAPKGRIILPEQQVLRELLDIRAIAIVVQTEQLPKTIEKFGDNIKLVVTDSQAFEEVARIIPKDMKLTSFSILMARYKGILYDSVNNAMSIMTLEDNDNVLICEACTHHRQCNDIGTVKLPKWITEYTKKKLNFDFVSGNSFPEDVSGYKLIIHCGGCMVNEKEVKYRNKCAKEQGVAFTNYGTTIALIKGILTRSISVLEGRLK